MNSHTSDATWKVQKGEAFIDDLSLRDVEGVRRDQKELEADDGRKMDLFPTPFGRPAE